MLQSREYKHFKSAEVFRAIINHGGPDLWDEYCELYHPSFIEGSSQKLYFPDWNIINEFYTRDWALWWEKAAEVMEIEPGDTIYFDFYN